ncbi:uncharacterized protein LAESUDRAFT_724515 [Laetiporus sulphureus 93-53]|uniref:BHLH domain-containing protein n=1 Tax=Laetiporus sulphureus 93-53 TaxID=1314785 RepID=A0A165EZD7_9APHY|nr:uncharacterized protein LAESUDRAFT_724515 [Laetiporus sulphureus 93-53]KZT08037.1 hypothetical protein LAESUDRAFT_724515 [Laetiporus sulphureus 93-53]
MSSPSSAASSSTSSMSAPSPTADHSQLTPEESLNLLLQTISQHNLSQNANPNPDKAQPTEPIDWEQLSAWSRNEAKMPDFSDFNFELPMDLDFDSNMAVDPSALHFNSIFDNAAMSLPTDSSFFLPATNPPPELLYPATDDFSWMTQSHVQPQTGRRLSVTSSSSSSGASLSPVSDNASVSSSPPSDSYLSDPAQELAQKVRQMAGVMLAVPVSAQVQQMAAAGGQAKLPIPRLPRPNTVPSKQSSPKSSPDPESASSSTAPSPKSESPAESAVPPPVQSVIGRPKTSHTTIERRYRTNLNARITGLKQAVPALRVLEAKVNGQENPYNDVVDSRGFVDGVKVARKMSKANVLGKAAEYIRVLKKRETRLKREQDGLKSLIAGLVGGPALLKEWEREWRERFGGEERDEIEDESAGAASDDEDGDGDDSEGEDGEEGRARKKPKVAKVAKKDKPPRPAPQPQLAVSTVPGAVPEKRKRGRPRKVPLPPAVAQAPALTAAATPVAATQNAAPIFPVDAQMPDTFVQTSSDSQTQQTPAQQYLLAAFAFFSVFNSPLASSRPHAHPAHEHHGTVLTPQVRPQAEVPIYLTTSSASGLGLHELVQAAHLLVSTLVFLYVILPWISSTLKRAPTLGSYVARLRTSCTTAETSATFANNVHVSKARSQQRAALMEAFLDALDPSRRGSADETARLRRALGVTDGIVGLMQGVIKAGRVDRGIELNQLEQRAWVRLGELVAFNDKVGKATRLQMYWCMSWHISTFAASTTDLSTLALIMRPVSSSKAATLWEAARKREFLRPYEKIVLDNMSVDVAADWLAKWQRWHETERKGRCAACEKRTPLGVLAAILIRERLRKHAASLFVRTVVRNDPRACVADECVSECEGYVYDAEKDYREEQERKETVQAGKSIGGRTAELALLLERIWDTGFCTHEDVLPPPRRTSENPDEHADCEDAHDLASTDEAEIRSLLSATMIYRRIFPSSFPACSTSVPFILSPPPSPSQRNAALHMALRSALASPAFEFGSGGRLEDEDLSVALEGSRDRVTDMLVELEQSCRRVSTRY